MVRPSGVIGRLLAGDIARGGPWFMAGDWGRPCGEMRIPGDGGPRGPFCWGRGLTGRVERHVRGTTPCAE
jgi:hypothetical protein